MWKHTRTHRNTSAHTAYTYICENTRTHTETHLRTQHTLSFISTYSFTPTHTRIYMQTHHHLKIHQQLLISCSSVNFFGRVCMRVHVCIFVCVCTRVLPWVCVCLRVWMCACDFFGYLSFVCNAVVEVYDNHGKALMLASHACDSVMNSIQRQQTWRQDTYVQTSLHLSQAHLRRRCQKYWRLSLRVCSHHHCR